MVIYLRNNPAAKFHPVPIWNDCALDISEKRRPNNNKIKKNDKMSSDMVSVPDPEIQTDWKNTS